MRLFDLHKLCILKIYFYFMHMSVLPPFCVPAGHEGQKMVADALELELDMFASQHVAV